MFKFRIGEVQNKRESWEGDAVGNAKIIPKYGIPVFRVDVEPGSSFSFHSLVADANDQWT